MPISRRAALALAGVGVIAAACAARPRQPDGDDASLRYPPLGDFAMVEGARIHVLDRPGPSPNAPAVALIHGASGNLRDFAFDFVDRLTPRYRVLAFDRPGLGHSDRSMVEDSHRPDVQARLLRGAMRARGVERAIVVGHSFGGAVAMAWALTAPDETLGVVNLAGATYPWPGGAGLFYELGATDLLGGAFASLARAALSEEGAKDAVSRIFRPQSPPEGYGEYVGAGLALRRDTLRWNAADIANLKPFLEVQSARYPTLTTPLEILHGDADRIVGLAIHSEPLAAAVPGARLTALKGIGHMPHHAAAEACVAAIDRVADAVAA